MSVPARLPFALQVSYAVGQLGWALLFCIIEITLIYVYLPPPEAQLPRLIPDYMWLGLFNLLAVVMFFTKLFEAAVYPVVAGFSDAFQSRFGRRIPFMAVGMVPAAVACGLMFVPPVQGASSANLYWLIGIQLLFFVAFACYTLPHNALLIELGHTDDERLRLSTYISITYALGLLIASVGPTLWDVLQVNLGMGKVEAMQWSTFGLSAFALVCMAIPVFTITERRYAAGQPADDSTLASLLTTLRNPRFLAFVLSDMVYWIGQAIVAAGLLYYITVLLGQDEKDMPLFLGVMLLVAFIFYPIVTKMANWFGKKLLMQLSFLLYALSFGLVFWLGKMPIDQALQGYLLVSLAAIPTAFLGILPNTVLANIAELDALQTGQNREAMFFAARTTLMRIGQIVGITLFTVLLTLGGRDVSETGVRYTGLAGFVLCIGALIIFASYNERQTMDQIATLRAQAKPLVSKPPQPEA